MVLKLIKSMQSSETNNACSMGRITLCSVNDGSLVAIATPWGFNKNEAQCVLKLK